MKKNYGLIGNSLSHSFSKKYFESKFLQHKIEANFENYECLNLDEVAKLLRRKDIAGLSVTIPYKTALMPLLSDLDESAKQVGAVNCIKFIGDKRIGFNTDVFGFEQLIKPFFEAHHERAMILGTGGASKAVAFVLESLGVDVIYISRHPKKGDEYLYQDINEKMMAYHGILVNTTPVGTFPNVHDCPEIPYEFLTSKHLLIDLVYNPKETEFLKNGKAQGVVVINGETMLHQQAERAWQIWNDL